MIALLLNPKTAAMISTTVTCQTKRDAEETEGSTRGQIKTIGYKEKKY